MGDHSHGVAGDLPHPGGVVRRRVEVGSRTVLITAALHTAIAIAAVWVNPFACIYAFVGYLDAGRFFRGRQVGVVVVVTALLCAFGQTDKLGVTDRASAVRTAWERGLV